MEYKQVQHAECFSLYPIQRPKNGWSLNSCTVYSRYYSCPMCICVFSVLLASCFYSILYHTLTHCLRLRLNNVNFGILPIINSKQTMGVCLFGIGYCSFYQKNGYISIQYKWVLANTPQNSLFFPSQSYLSPNKNDVLVICRYHVGSWDQFLNPV